MRTSSCVNYAGIANWLFMVKYVYLREYIVVLLGLL